jgi:ferredoxin--NADP+ reductase
VISAAVTQKWIEGKVAAQERWTETLFSLKVDADIPFEAGQFAKLALEVDGEMLARP